MSDSARKRKGKIRKAGQRLARLVVNTGPTRLINFGYDYYSRVKQGQLRLGLPVPRDLIKTQEELRVSASAKLALSLYHIFLRSAGTRIPRLEIKLAILEELEKGNLKLTENVIILTREQIELLNDKHFKINEKHLPAIFVEAGRRRILKEALRNLRLPAYFESEIEEREENGRGDYETVYYRDFTNEGKEIQFRRLVSMEDVTAGDERPSVILVPGFACNSNNWNVTNEYSVAKDLADMGFWMYLFDPRGMGVNEGKFDPFYTVDTLIDFDLPTVVRHVYSRSRGKPSILMGHSMGGMISEFMVLTWNLRKQLDNIYPGQSEEKARLDAILPTMEEAEHNLKTVRGIITLGSPKYFQRESHLIFACALWLNHVAKMFRFSAVPVREAFWLLTQPPFMARLGPRILRSDIGGLNFLVCEDNHRRNTSFAHDYVDKALESVPLGLGFQFVKAIYNGEGFKRMDGSRLNYSASVRHLPTDIPVFRFFGTKDPLAALYNLKYRQQYPHRVKKEYYLAKPSDLKKVDITTERSQVVDFIIEGANHVDLQYGKAARELIFPLVRRIIHQVWDDWSYGTDGKAKGGKTKDRALKAVSKA